MEWTQEAIAERRKSNKESNARFAFVVLGILVLLIPLAYATGGFTGTGRITMNDLALLHRLAALLAISFMLLEIMTDFLRPQIIKVFDRTQVYVTQVFFGIAGLAFVGLHFVLFMPRIGQYVAVHNVAFMTLGLISMGLLIATVMVRLLPRRSQGFARWMNRIDYLVIFIAVVHGLLIGADRNMLWFKVILLLYGAIALFGLEYRAITREGWHRALSRAEAPRKPGLVTVRPGLKYVDR